MSPAWEPGWVSADEEVLTAARARAEALAAGDTRRLSDLLHSDFGWTSHTGEKFDKAQYVEANTTGGVVWHEQELHDPEISIVKDAAVLRAVVSDTVAVGTGLETYRMPMTQFWVRTSSGWKCLAGHAGPRLSP
jgi:hypothetical protein